jgi:hypothetical protein
LRRHAYKTALAIEIRPKEKGNWKIVPNLTSKALHATIPSYGRRNDACHNSYHIVNQTAQDNERLDNKKI